MMNESEQLLQNMLGTASKNHQEATNKIFSEVNTKIGFADERASFINPINTVEKIFEKHTLNISLEAKKSIRIALIAKMGLRLLASIDKLDLPQSIVDLYPQSFSQFIQHVSKNNLGEYCPPDDFYCKDLSFMLGLSVPCGAQTVDIAAKLKPYSIILSFLRSKKFYPTYLYLRARGYGSWFGIHTDTRNLTDFNEQGWDDCYKRIAELLERRKHIRGMVGTSWFYDPQLLKISPRLAYLQERPLERGAFMLKHGTGKLHVERATLTSKTRARLYHEGKYTPTAYSIVWPREEMIAWAKRI